MDEFTEQEWVNFLTKNYCIPPAFERDNVCNDITTPICVKFKSIIGIANPVCIRRVVANINNITMVTCHNLFLPLTRLY